MTSRMDSSPAKIMTRRSKPKAIPREAGPVLSASSRKPNFRSAAGLSMPSALKTACWTSTGGCGYCPRDFGTVQNQIIGPRPRLFGTGFQEGISSSRGEVNGWCMAWNLFSSGFHSRRGKSRTQTGTNRSLRTRPRSRPVFYAGCRVFRASGRPLQRPAAKRPLPGG